jgi:hypothetical protein
MEGYKDVYWTGDRIVWRNLLRHYLLCLLEASSCLSLGPQFDGAYLKTTIFLAPESLPEAPVRSIFQRMCHAFLANANIGKWPETLSARPTPVRRDELTHYLRALHPFRLAVLLEELKGHGIDGIFRNVPALQAQASTLGENLSRVAELKPSDGEVAEELFAASELMTAQLELIHDYNHETPPEARAFKFLTRDFPTSYVRALDELIHPPWHAACFVADPANASMWATYGEAYRGVCLKFKTVPDSASRPALKLNVINGWRGGRGKEMEPVRSFVPHAFHEVKYSESYPEIDFFNSIGRLPIAQCVLVQRRGR